MRSVVAGIFGTLVGISGTFLHNSYRPIGILVSLFAIYLALRLIRNMQNSKFAELLFVIGWLFIVVRASTLGNGGEVLIEANLYGNVFVFGGIAIAVFALLRKSKS